MKKNVKEDNAPVIDGEENVALKHRMLIIKPPKFEYGEFVIKAAEDVPLVIHRQSQKLKQELLAKAVAGKSSASKKERTPLDVEKTYNEARYVSAEGWDGFHAGAIRNALISACRLVNFKMVLAKLSVFVVADGRDAKEPQIPLVRIYGDPVMQQDLARVETGQPYVTIRPAYHNWKARLRLRWDADQFSANDIMNLTLRVGGQVGIGEGRPDSKNSAGMGWGLFDIAAADEIQ